SRRWSASSPDRRTTERDDLARPGGLARRHQDDDFSLTADRERMHGEGDARAAQGRDPLALEKPPDDDGLGLIAPVHFHERSLFARRGRRSHRERNDLRATGHGLDYSRHSHAVTPRRNAASVRRRMRGWRRAAARAAPVV